MRTVSSCAAVTLFVVGVFAAKGVVAHAQDEEPATESAPAEGAEVADRAPLRSLADLLASAERTYPGLRAARHRITAAAALLDEARTSPYDQFTFTAGGAFAPEAQGTPIYSPDGQLPLSNGWQPLGLVQVQGAIPIYTFGKLEGARDAASAGVRAAEHDEARARAELRLNLRRAYFAYLLATEGVALLADAQQKLEGAVTQFQERLDAGDPDVEELDRFRLAAALAEIRARASDAERGQRSAWAALSLVAGIERFRVTECSLEPVDLELRPLAWYQQAARLHRPESGMLQAGIDARRAAVSAAQGFYFPDIALVLNASFSEAPGRTRQINPFIFDASNQPQLGALLVARWNLDFAGTYFRTARAEAQLLDTEAQVDEARLGISLEVATSYEEVRDAQRRLQSWLQGYRDARAWFVAAAQAYEVGTLDPGDLIEALRAYFTARFAHMQSIHDLDVAAAHLERVVGTDLVPEDAWEHACEEP